MGNYLRKLTVVASVCAASCLSDRAVGQVIVGRGGGISLSIPGVGGVRVGAPLRRGIVVAPYGTASRYGAYGYGTPNAYGYGAVTRYSARPVLSGSDVARAGLPTAGELRAMEDNELLNVTHQLASQLHSDLNVFDTGDTWQRYLAIPAEALPPANVDGQVILGRQALIDTLARFDRTVANGRYVQISGLPSYTATHAALAELVRRFAASGPVASTSGSVTPPALPQPPQSVTVERRESATSVEEPQSIEMRNLHAANPGVAADGRGAVAKPAESREELPTPPPALVAPGNNGGAERSVLAR